MEHFNIDLLRILLQNKAHPWPMSNVYKHVDLFLNSEYLITIRSEFNTTAKLWIQYDGIFKIIHPCSKEEPFDLFSNPEYLITYTPSVSVPHVYIKIRSY